MKNSFNNVMVVRTEMSNGKPYRMKVTRSREIIKSLDGVSPDREKELEARSQGRAYVYDLTRKIWRSVKVTGYEDAETGEMVPWEYIPRKYTPRMSFKEACDVLSQFNIFVEKADTGYSIYED